MVGYKIIEFYNGWFYAYKTSQFYLLFVFYQFIGTLVSPQNEFF